MDLLTLIANEFEIPFVQKTQKVWFFRTKAGRFYYDFLLNNFIALGWDLISPEIITSYNLSKDVKKEKIELLYPDEKRPGLILGQMDVFYNEMRPGDFVVIPSEGSKEITIGIVGTIANVIERKANNEEYPQCTFCHKRNVSWLKKVDAWQDVYLFKALRAQQTISDITEESKLVLRNLFPLYISGDYIHFTLQKSTNNELSLAHNVDLLFSVLNIADATASLYGQDSFRNEMSIKTAVGSPGFFELIFPGIPVAAITVGLLKGIIGKEKTADGGTATGILAIITKINELINDYHNRKKTDAETRLIGAQATKMLVEADLVKAQIAKTNAEVRQLELHNSQIELLLSGKTTEEAQKEHEMLVIPEPGQMTSGINAINNSATKLCDAAETNGLSYAGKKIGKVG